MIVWVAGGRDYTDKTVIAEELELVADPDTLLVTGAARGTDLIAERIWREDFELPYLGIPARWTRLGKRAGFVRNQIIAEGYRGLVPDVLIHFPGGRGTQMAIDLAVQNQIRTSHR